MRFINYRDALQRFIVHLQYNNDVIISLFTERV